MTDPEVSVQSYRPDATRVLMKQTGLDDTTLTVVVYRFYDKVRKDDLLSQIFEDRITAWGPHLERMVEFWSSVALMTGRYHGRPVQAHRDLPVTWTHFERWLELFRETVCEVCSPVGAAHLIERAERIAHSLNMAVQAHASHPAGD